MIPEKLTFVINSLQIGGVEKALVALSNHAVKNSCVKFILFEKKKNELLNELNPSIEIQYVNWLQRVYMKADKYDKKTINKGLLILKGVIRILENLDLKEFTEKILFHNFRNEICDVAISYTGYPGPWDSLAKACKAEKKVAYVHSNPHLLGIAKLNPELYYDEFDEIICISKDIENSLHQIEPLLKQKTRVVYNMIDKQKIKRLACEDSPYCDNKHIIVTVARIDNRSKRFDRIIECAYIMVSKGFTNFKWYIVGDGPDLEMVKNLAKKKLLDGYICFEGMKDNPYSYIKNADVFVLASDYEGYPITIMETIFLGTPPIITDFTSAKEVVQDKQNGIIVEKNSDSLATGIMNLLTNDELYYTIKKQISC